MKVIHKWNVYVIIEAYDLNKFRDEVRVWAGLGYKPVFPPQMFDAKITQQWHRKNISFVLFSSFWYSLKSTFDWIFRRGKWLQDNSDPELTSEE